MEADNELIEAFWIEQGGKAHLAPDIYFYESDWNMLMPVVEKIQSVIREDSSYLLETCGKVNENEEDIKKWREWQNRKIKLRTSIEGVYGDVVEFIKWCQQTVTPKE